MVEPEILAEQTPLPNWTVMVPAGALATETVRVPEDQEALERVGTDAVEIV